MKYRAWYQRILDRSKVAKKAGVIGLRVSGTFPVEANSMAEALLRFAEHFQKNNIDAEIIKIRVHPKSQLGDR